MSKEDNGEQRFIKDVAEHKMEIIRDDGVNRHIRFKRPGTTCMHFDLITWPGYLCYTGDMGTYVFQRLRDMFEFFRMDREYAAKKGGALTINPQYWGEKLEAVDRHGGFMEYSKEEFHRVVQEIVDRHVEDEGLSAVKAADFRDAIASDVLTDDDSEHEARQAVEEFEHKGFVFEDFWEYDLKDYSFRFLWCCYAIAWGIQKYDDAKAQVKEAA